MSENMSRVINDYKIALRNTGASTSIQMLKIAKNLYDAMIQHYEYCEEMNLLTHQYRICQLIDEEVLPKLDKGIIGTTSLKVANELFAIRKKFFALSSRRILKNFALYIESYKKKKIWDKTMETVEPVFYYADQFIISDTLNLMRVSCMPGLGKSYMGNLLLANAFGNNPNLSALRITFSDDLVKITTAQTKAIMKSQAYKEIFPRYANPDLLYKGKYVFKKDDNHSFCLCDCEDEFNLFAVTREGQATGKRAKLVVIDDLLKGETESTNVTLHKQLVDRYDSDWSSRADDDNQKTLLLGTMWANTDLLNVMYDRATSGAESLIADPKHRFTELTQDRKSVFIGIPALDKYDNSTCPKRFSSESLKNKRKFMSKYLWQAVYMQDPIAPDGLEFNYSVLQTYSEKVTKRSDIRYGALDPARRGKNYVSMPIVYGYPREDSLDDIFYLVDFLYQKKGMDDLYDPIVDMIIKHQLNQLVIENNTDTSLKTVLEERLHKKGYYGCNIVEKYSTQNKEQRIKDYQSTVRNSIVYPAQNLFSPITQIGEAMESITSYSFNYPNKFDDAIDSVVLLCMEFINNKLEFPTIGTFKRTNF